MRSIRFALLLAATLLALPAVAAAQADAPLRVIRVTPSGDAGPDATISVTFDRPVAGSLDRSVDPASIMRVEPAVAGRLEWRDPVTIRLVPAAALASGARYAVTVANSFRAMDGSALAEPYHFEFRVRGPTLLAGAPAGPNARPEHVVPDQRFEVVYSAPVDLGRLSSAAFLEFGAACGGQRVIPLRATAQRRLGSDDDWRLRQTGDFPMTRGADSLRRVVQLAPTAALPRGCNGDLVLPWELADDAQRGSARWGFSTYGELRIVAVRCADGQQFCPVGPLTVEFTNPVRGSEVQRRAKLIPELAFVVRDTSAESTTWTLEARLTPHTGYALVVDTSVRDVFGQPLRGNPAAGFATTGFGSAVNYPYGSLVVERDGFGTLTVQHINVDTLVALIAPVPDSLEARMLTRSGWSNDSVWAALVRGARLERIPVHAPADRVAMTNVKLPPSDTGRAGTLLAVKISGRTGTRMVSGDGPVALLQVTNLGVHARVGPTEGMVWVTGVNDGLPRAGATVVLRGADGRQLATAKTDANGLARLAGWRTRAVGDDDPGTGYQPLDGYVSVVLGNDRAIAAINKWDADLSPWNFNVSEAYGDARLPLAGAVFTERGIYRPGERVYAKAIVRDGALGALRVPAPGDSVKWLFHDRDRGMLRERTAPLSAFGTADQSLELPAGAAIGTYALAIQVKRQGRWRDVAQTSYRVAEYRPPEFLVDLRADSAPHLPGDAFAATVQARYLFGARMGRAAVSWMARRSALWPWEFEIPGTDGWSVGDEASWWDESEEYEEHDDAVFASRVDTLDALGERTWSLELPAAVRGRATRVTLEAAVTDVNRQVVGTSATTIVHPAEFYVAVRPTGDDYFWRTGTARSIAIKAVRPSGEQVPGVRVTGTLVRREWHRVRRERNGVAETVGDWVTDTVSTCAVTTSAAEASCTFTPKEGGMYIASFKATDAKGRAVSTSFERWAAGPGWVPWSDETQFKMDVIADKSRYAVGDTATVLFASPFTNAEAWITIEREGLISQRRMRLTSGSTTIRLPITEAYAPNAFVSILVARGRSAKPGPLDDPGRPTIRVGYAELRVTPEVKRLAVALEPDRPEYRPADSARVRVHVRDARSRGVRSEVTLWAVDEGVLALTGYRTPDPIDRIYRARGLGMRLASNLTAVAPQVPEGEKGKREAGGGGGAAGADVLRSRFQTTAFFLGSVVTDAQGDGVAAVKLPDNLTTFKVMAVAVTAGDRYGKGETSMLVTRPLLARQALPRFVRPGDSFTAGAVINRRDGQPARVHVTAQATGARLRGDSERDVTLAPSRGAEVRFPFQAQRVDSATFRFDVTGGPDADAVRVTLPVRPDHHPQAQTVAGVLHDTATIELAIPAGLDLARSRLSLNLGNSPLATIRGIGQQLHIYPYYCSEQVISTAVPLIALYRAQRPGGLALPGDPKRDIARAVEILSRRQREDGGVGYWSATDWTTAWLSAYAGITLLDARLAGVTVDTAVLSRLATYLTNDLHGTGTVAFSPVAYWQERRGTRLRDQVAAVDYLSRLGRPDIAAENELLRTAAQLAMEDRARLAEVFARRRQATTARRLLEPTWARIRVEGSRAVLPDSAPTPFYFTSAMRPLARVLMATLAVDPEHALVGPMVEALAQQGRAAQRGWIWNTQDYASAVQALERYDRYRQAVGDRTVRVRAGNRVILESNSAAANGGRDTSIALATVVSGDEGSRAVTLALDAGAGDGAVFYYLTLTEIPAAPPVTPVDRGVQVERWYERFDTGKPATSVAEGDLVRVRLRITVPSTRYFVVLDDALPGGLEAVDLSLRTASAMPGPGAAATTEQVDHEEQEEQRWGYGYWDSGWWSPFDHREIRDDRVVYSASVLWAGTYTASYLARATTAGTFVKPPAHAEEMYNPAVSGRSDGGTFEVTPKGR